jgi:hypothetical protein
MGRKKKVGRPKMPVNQKKVGFSVKVMPNLMEAINTKTEGKNRNEVVESVLKREFL